MEDSAPGVESLVGGEDHRALAAMAIVDDVEEHIRSVSAIGQITHLVDHDQRRMGVGDESLGQAPGPESRGQLVYELSRGNEEGVKSVLNGPVGDGHGQVRLAPARLAMKDQAAS